MIVAVYPTAADIGRWLRAPVLDYELLLDADANDGYVRDWQAPVMSPERHLAYAGQWLLFGLGSIAAAVAVARSARASRAPEEPGAVKRAALVPWLVALAVFGPFVAALLLYYVPADLEWLPRCRARGELLEPPLAAPPGWLELAPEPGHVDTGGS